MPRGVRPVTITAGAHALTLLPERAVFDARTNCLLLADVHLGKAASFRALGVPVPGGTTQRTLARIDALIEATGVSGVYMLGDLLHGRHARARALFDALRAWRERHASIDIVLVRGNHDDRAGDPPRECGITAVDPGHRLGDLRLLHEPPHAPDDEPRSDEWSLAGHLHPVWRLRGRVDSIRVPCFWQRGRSIVLPAFGEFTGGFRVPRRAGDRVFVACGETVAAVPESRAPGRH